MDQNLTIGRALLSVSDKTDIGRLAAFLAGQNVEIVSTGGTAEVLREQGLEVVPIEELTGQPEVFGGRMKTISFQIESAILFRRDNDSDADEARALGIVPIDLVVCNLYPFTELARRNTDFGTLIEYIDIGGPTMIRAAAKNYRHVAVLSRPEQYDPFMELVREKRLDEAALLDFALDAIGLTAHYDQFIFNTLAARAGRDDLPLAFRDARPLRYGENPHQRGWLIPWRNSRAAVELGEAELLQGKEVSYNNMADADAAWKCSSELQHSFPGRAVVCVVKHGNPCGAAVAAGAMGAAGANLQVLEEAWDCDPVSSFGSIIAFSREVDEAEADWLRNRFVELIIAPAFSEDARKVFARKKNLRLIACPIKPAHSAEKSIKSINGGLLIQDEDELQDYVFRTVTSSPFPEEKQELSRFGMIVCKYLKSNSIALVDRRNNCMVILGAGMGQPNRLDSLRQLAAERAMQRTARLENAVLLSEAFFPFRDSIDAAQSCGIRFIVQPGGSIRDEEVIQACNEHQIAMCFTGIRHFRH